MKSQDNVTEAAEYEKSFLERYFRAQAKKKLDKLEEEMSKSKSTQMLQSYTKKKKAILDELENNLVSLQADQDILFSQSDNTAPSNIPESTHTQTHHTDTHTQTHHTGTHSQTHHTNTEPDKKHRNYTITATLWNSLFDYQRTGVIWMLDLHAKGNGGILADEMGLGKTIQAIAFVSAVISTGNPQRVFVVAPATLVSHWVDEFKKYTPQIPVSVDCYSKNNQVTITGYESFRRRYNGERIDLLILDEGHKIKNKDAHITMALKATTSQVRFILTGTPIQNNLSELWSLFDFISPGLLGSYNTFHEEFEEKIYNRKEPELAYRYSTMLRAVIEPYILRRMKAKVAHSLPKRTDGVIFVTLTPQQESLYIRALDSKYVKRAFLNKNALLGAIDHLRKICNHPFLLHNKACNQGESSEQSMNQLKSTTHESDLVESSCKVIALLDLLNKWKKEGHRTLVFTQTVQMQRILERVLKSKSFSFMKLSGRVSINSRSALIEQFNNDHTVDVFLLTTRIGGLGLNLTSASRIVLYDPDWNPSTDTQAKERIHRYGQQQDVETYRLICKNTLEEKIYQRQIYKECLTRKILSNPRIKFNHESFFDLFDYRTCGSAEAEVRPYEGGEALEEGVLQEVRDEDRASFELMKEMNNKKMLSGYEMIQYIERREMSL